MPVGQARLLAGPVADWIASFDSDGFLRLRRAQQLVAE